MKKILMITLSFALAGAIFADMAPVDGANTVGFSSVADTGNDVAIITVPYVACLNNDSDIMLSDLVSTNGLVGASSVTSADQLVVLTTNEVGDLRYCYYWLQAGTGWTGISTSVMQPDGTNRVFNPPAASEFPISRGEGFWMKRVVSSSNPVYVQGEVSASNPSTTIIPGLNLVGYGTAAALEINGSSINWSGAYGDPGGNTQNSDKIIVVNGDGSITTYFYFVCPAASAWDNWRSLDNKWINSDYTLATGSVSAGRGFWYSRRGSTSYDLNPDD